VGKERTGVVRAKGKATQKPNITNLMGRPIYAKATEWGSFPGFGQISNFETERVGRR